MKTREEAVSLARRMMTIGERMGVKISHRLSPMEEPLGETVGNALEVAEAVETLQGRGPNDLVTLTLDLASEVVETPRARLAEWLSNGAAWETFVALIEEQGGEARALEKMAERHGAPFVRPMLSPCAGRVTRMDARTLGRAALFLGAGRARTDDAIDHAVGFARIKKVGTEVAPNEPLFFVHARREDDLATAFSLLEKGVTIE